MKSKYHKGDLGQRIERYFQEQLRMNQAKELKCPKDSKEPSTVRQKEAKLKSNKTAQIFQEVAQRANEIYKENQKSKQDLLDQISDYEALLQDRQGLEMAYRRMHEINHLVKDIETFCASKYNRKLRDVIIDLPSEILHDNPRIDEDVIKFSSNMINSLYTHKIDHESSKCD